MKVDVILIVSAVVVFLGLYLLFPYTDMGKEAYETNRNNAILYITSVRFEPDPGYQREIQRLIDKYDLQDYFSFTDNLSNINDYFKSEP